MDAVAVRADLAQEEAGFLQRSRGVVDGRRVDVGLAECETQFREMGHLVDLTAGRLEQDGGDGQTCDVVHRQRYPPETLRSAADQSRNPDTRPIRTHGLHQHGLAEHWTIQDLPFPKGRCRSHHQRPTTGFLERLQLEDVTHLMSSRQRVNRKQSVVNPAVHGRPQGGSVGGIHVRQQSLACIEHATTMTAVRAVGVVDESPVDR